jgi:hypothetical protein
MLTPYSYTLFVDPSGNNSTAIIGDYTKPWQTINAAINYAGTSSQPTNGYTVHIFRGNYTATQSVTYAANKSISLFFEPNANLDVTLPSVGLWFNHDGGTASINISGSGRSTNYISSNYGVFKIGASTQASAYNCVLNIHDIRISSSNGNSFTSAGEGVVIGSQKSSVNIDNSIISLTTAGSTVNIYQYVIYFTQGYISIIDSTIEMNSQTAQPIYPAQGNNAGWLIFENGLVSGTTDVGRIRLQNTYLSQYGNGGGGAIYSYGNGYVPGISSQSIFLANVYYQAVASKTYTVYCYPKQDSVYIGGSVVSGGPSPDSLWSSGYGAWQNPAPAVGLAIYNLGNSNMPRPY